MSEVTDIIRNAPNRAEVFRLNRIPELAKRNGDTLPNRSYGLYSCTLDCSFDSRLERLLISSENPWEVSEPDYCSWRRITNW